MHRLDTFKKPGLCAWEDNIGVENYELDSSGSG
jgi:hypothetical protein